MKNFNKLSLAILILGASLFAFSFIPEIEFMKQIMNNHYGKCHQYIYCGESPHYHWNYRHYIYLVTGIVLTIVQVVRIVHIFDRKDFNE